MQINKLIAELQHVKEGFGDIEVCLVNTLEEGLEHHTEGQADYIAHESFWIIPEEYDRDDGSGTETICNLRTWPY